MFGVLYIYNMTKAQQRVQHLLDGIKKKVGEEITPAEMNILRVHLSENKNDSIWGHAIQSVFANGGDVDQLIENLASQAYDDPFTMSCIVGLDSTILLLKTFR